MTTTKYAATGRFIGKCVVCKRKVVADSEESKPRGCACRAGVPCLDRFHGHDAGATDNH
jgi:hypothetical protein